MGSYHEISAEQTELSSGIRLLHGYLNYKNHTIIFRFQNLNSMRHPLTFSFPSFFNFFPINWNLNSFSTLML